MQDSRLHKADGDLVADKEGSEMVEHLDPFWKFASFERSLAMKHLLSVEFICCHQGAAAEKFELNLSQRFV